MLARLIALACSLALCAADTAVAQTDGPAEQPAADYQGQSYVDSKGCIFLRAGYGGTATWVPRVNQNHKQICGQTPTNAIANVATAAADDDQSAAKIRIPKRAAQATSSVKPLMIGCPVSVPVPRRYATTDGGSVVICTAKNGSLTGARSPIYPNGSGVGAALSSIRHPGVTIPLQQNQVAAASATISPKPPAGYERAWKDDRLNPLRGKSVAGGQVVQTVTAERKDPANSTAMSVSAARFVQIGTYAEPSNAEGVIVRLKALGLPVSKGKFNKQGRPLQVVYAGPFGSGFEVQAALNAARGIGFSDAFIR